MGKGEIADIVQVGGKFNAGQLISIKSRVADFGHRGRDIYLGDFVSREAPILNDRERGRQQDRGEFIVREGVAADMNQGGGEHEVLNLIVAEGVVLDCCDGGGDRKGFDFIVGKGSIFDDFEVWRECDKFEFVPVKCPAIYLGYKMGNVNGGEFVEGKSIDANFCNSGWYDDGKKTFPVKGIVADTCDKVRDDNIFFRALIIGDYIFRINSKATRRRPMAC